MNQLKLYFIVYVIISLALFYCTIPFPHDPTNFINGVHLFACFCIVLANIGALVALTVAIKSLLGKR